MYNIKRQLIAFLVIFALFLSLKEKGTLFLLNTSIAICSALVFETTIFYLSKRKFLFSESALISGLIIGYVISTDEPALVFVFSAFVAICSKYILKIKGKYLFNPAGLGIFLAILIFGATTQWKGTYYWYILLPFGFYFAYRIKRLEILLGYFLAFLVIFGLQAIFQKRDLLTLAGYLSYFYLAVMLIEPKTTPLTQPAKFFFGAGVIFLSFTFTELSIKFDVDILSLLILNLITPILNKFKKNWKGGALC